MTHMSEGAYLQDIGLRYLLIPIIAAGLGSLVCEIGRLKKCDGSPVYQPDREKLVLDHVRSVAAEGPLGPDAIGRLFERIIDEARRLERRVVHGEDAGDAAV